MKKLDQKLINYANALIDDMCEAKGVQTTIDNLVAFGFTKKELEQLKFGARDIETYFK